MTEGMLRIGGFKEENLTPNGYDLTIGEVLIPSLDRSCSDGSVGVPANTWFLIGTVEFLDVGPKLAGDIWIRTTWARRGIIPAFGKVDAGFKGNLTLSALNASEKEVEFRVGDTFAQITFQELRSPPSMSYAERSGTYQGQVGVTLSRPSGREHSGPE
ncbi:MAG: dCTP deaminase [Thermoplasmata archaeon]